VAVKNIKTIVKIENIGRSKIEVAILNFKLRGQSLSIIDLRLGIYWLPLISSDLGWSLVKVIVLPCDGA
jgi:hypothetical protein